MSCTLCGVHKFSSPFVIAAIRLAGLKSNHFKRNSEIAGRRMALGDACVTQDPVFLALEFQAGN